MRRSSIAAAVAVTAALAAAGCGGGSGSGTKTINLYVFNEPGGTYEKAVDTCNAQAKGAYKISYQRLPTEPNQQRDLLVRRLAAKDSSVDVLGMDVIWTAEFAEAGWIKPWEGADKAAAAKDKLKGPLRTVQYQGKTWGIPFTSNTQLLWYRKDRIKRPLPTTWSELIDEAARRKTTISLVGAQYEGLSTWVNALVASQGGQIVNQDGDVKVDGKVTRAAQIIRDLATRAAPEGFSTAAEDEARLGFQGGASDFQVNYPFIYASAAEVKGLQKKIGWARYPAVEKGMKSRPSLGGINLGVGAYSKNPKLAFRAARCLAQPKNQATATEVGGLPPTTQSVYDDPKVKKAYPFRKLLEQSIEDAGPRPVTPAYSDISLAIQKTFHPEKDVQPDQAESKLRDRLDKAAQGKIF